MQGGLEARGAHQSALAYCVAVSVRLKQGVRQVTEVNKEKYVEMRAQWELAGRIETQLKVRVRGLAYSKQRAGIHRGVVNP